MFVKCKNDKGKKKDIKKGSIYFAVEGNETQYLVSGMRDLIYLNKDRFEVVE